MSIYRSEGLTRDGQYLVRSLRSMLCLRVTIRWPIRRHRAWPMLLRLPAISCLLKMTGPFAIDVCQHVIEMAPAKGE